MLKLMHKEFVQIRQYILQIAGFLVLAMLFFGKLNPALVASYLSVIPVTVAMTMPQILFGQEERSNTFVFLRTLPIRPKDIVAAKYLTGASIIVGFTALVVVAAAIGLAGDAVGSQIVAIVAFASFALSGLSFFLHFWLGLKSARVALLIAIFVLGTPIMMMEKGTGALGSALSALWTRAAPVIATPAGAGALPVAGLALLYLSYVASAAIFTRRDLSRLP